MIYFTGDLHLGHANIIQHCNRPFSSTQQMNETIISNWNNRVNADDDVYVLGDVAYRSGTDVGSMLKKLKGHKHLILGNHDRTWIKYCDPHQYFESVDQLGWIEVDGCRLFLCHYPMMAWDGAYHGSYLVHGHIHNTTSQSYWPLIAASDHMLNAGVDINYFHPVSFQELIRNNAEFKLRTKPDPKALIKQAAHEIQEFGGTSVVCPQCGKKPVYDLQGNSRLILACKCHYLFDCEIW